MRYIWKENKSKWDVNFWFSGNEMVVGLFNEENISLTQKTLQKWDTFMDFFSTNVLSR